MPRFVYGMPRSSGRSKQLSKVKFALFASELARSFCFQNLHYPLSKCMTIDH